MTNWIPSNRIMAARHVCGKSRLLSARSCAFAFLFYHGGMLSQRVGASTFISFESRGREFRGLVVFNEP
jgi:hypothetical protein